MWWWSKIALIAWLFAAFENIQIVISYFYAILPRLQVVPLAKEYYGRK